ncbi:MULTISPECIES: carboxyl-terminal processing protease CtpC [Planktothrix]|jgi:carboxyl-terminal processing protease|uniref:Carboxyl-terminal-processing protease n=2 Tax=Planktothrix TaxID=54304 RepID=A0A4P5Z8J3_PLAAG|nr:MULTISPECIES: carboxyl-terminal processing protease CtpC [Planktothrix]CAD5956920.1 Carboxyl-terminal-processing protease [Planktothrix rubescens]CAC5343953.1 Carboxyl-terminal-processing protease [Planktothrix rubescens NIVA-CYA 18]CAD0227004.1 Carboxyl-terminal-processing protease [Planktothrix agardhii]CAD5914157.1 Carboxyl-terminal-processing protease [Planktothrix agardhii]CAD5973317.1 Carboxyl-terminal-processing protease [Planktothrix agardhii]
MIISRSGLVLGATAMMLTAVTVAGAGIHLSSQASFRESPKELIDEVWQVIQKSYVDGTFNQVDWVATRTEYLNRNYADDEQAYKAIREMLKKLDDPYTRFMNPEEFKNMQIDTSGELTGVGIQLTQDEKTKKLVVISPIEDSPAFSAGVQSQDIITEIDGRSTEGIDINEAVSLIRGPVGTKVNIKILRGDKPLDFNITRDRIEIHPVRASKNPSSKGDIGYIRLNTFSANAAEEMRDAISDLEKQNVSGYVLDLRSNPGGLLYSSVEIARMWLNQGDIVSTVDRQGETDREKANNRALTSKPLVVLVDGGSASASEILSGALQDNKRALLVGTKTFGKGLVQSVRGVGKSSGLAVTIAKYFTPSGRDINHEGIQPDIKIELTEKQRDELRKDRTKVGTIDDPQYVKGLEILGAEISKTKQGTQTKSK